MLPVSAGVIGEVFAAGSDGHPPPIIDMSHSGAVAAGLLRSELPGFASINGMGGHAVRAAGFLVIAAHCHNSIIVTNGKRKDPGGSLATCNGGFCGSPGTPRVQRVKNARGGTAGAEENLHCKWQGFRRDLYAYHW